MALVVTATSTEQTGENSSTVLNMNVHVNPVVDMTASTHDVHVTPADLAAGIAVPIVASSPDDEGYSFTLELPSGWQVSSPDHIAADGSHVLTPSATVVFTRAELAGVTLLPPAGFTGSEDIIIHLVAQDGTVTKTFDLTSTVTVDNTPPAVQPAPAPVPDQTVADTGDQTTTDSVDIQATASPLDDYLQFAVQSDGHGGPSLSITSPFASASDDAALYIQALDHGSSIPLDIAASSAETGDVVAVRILGLPEGAQVSAGHASPNGIWVLAPDELPGLTITPPAGFTGEMDLTIKAVSHDADGSIERTAIHDVVIEVPADAADATATEAPTPLQDYLQFAAPSPEVGADGTADATTGSPVDDYLAAAGVDPAAVAIDMPDLPPTEVLIDSSATHDATTTDHGTVIDDAALATVLPDSLEQPPEDTQHHGV
jgi:hypothetical protein